MKDRERRLTETAQETGSDTEDAVAYAEIERRHQDFERAQEENERVRYLSFITGAGSALVGVAAAALYGFFWALPFLMLAIGATIASVLLLAAPRDGPQGGGGGAASRRRDLVPHLPDPPGQRPASATTTPAGDDAGGRGAPGRDGRVAGPRRRRARSSGRSSTAARSRSRRRTLRDGAGVRNPLADEPAARSEDNRAELAHALLERLQRLKTHRRRRRELPAAARRRARRRRARRPRRRCSSCS